jgi:hypothetical protein
MKSKAGHPKLAFETTVSVKPPNYAIEGLVEIEDRNIIETIAFFQPLAADWRKVQHVSRSRLHPVLARRRRSYCGAPRLGTGYVLLGAAPLLEQVLWQHSWSRYRHPHWPDFENWRRLRNSSAQADMGPTA